MTETESISQKKFFVDRARAGGLARAQLLSPTERSRIAAAGGKARWEKARKRREADRKHRARLAKQASPRHAS